MKDKKKEQLAPLFSRNHLLVIFSRQTVSRRARRERGRRSCTRRAWLPSCDRPGNWPCSFPCDTPNKALRSRCRLARRPSRKTTSRTRWDNCAANPRKSCPCSQQPPWHRLRSLPEAPRFARIAKKTRDAPPKRASKQPKQTPIHASFRQLPQVAQQSHPF